ncbi:MAG TPA: general secretion pathway protein GspB [Steroidobacteraceae bacterium]|nr:general secretion pathway protein GspB [Steroidobacteraceae bacterium]
MSFILDALKKSETDRQRQASPALFEVKVAAPRRKFPMWAVALAVLLGVNVLALAWVLLRKSDASPTAQAVPAAAAAAAAPGTSGASQPGMVTVQIPVGTASSVTVGPNTPATGSETPVGTQPLTDEPLLEGQEPAVPPDYDTRDYRPALTPEQAGAIAAARRSGALPSRDEVLAQGNQLPDLRLDLHVYDANPVNRFVFINMRKLKEGETLPEGVRVDQITPRGAELSYRGTRFTIDGN